MLSKFIRVIMISLIIHLVDVNTQVCGFQGTTEYVQCDEGYYVKDASACVICPAGYNCECNSLGEQCKEQFYSRDGDMKCLQCENGTYTDEKAQSQCKDCPVGHSCVYGLKEKCKPGQIAPQPKSPNCIGCESGISNSSRTECLPCPAGHRCVSGSIQKCPVGSYAKEGDGKCSQCQSKATFQNKPGQCSCIECPKNSVCPLTTRAPVACPDKYCGSEVGYCQKCDNKICPPGSFKSGTDCSKCPDGTFSDNWNQKQCNKCDSNCEVPDLSKEDRSIISRSIKNSMRSYLDVQPESAKIYQTDNDFAFSEYDANTNEYTFAFRGTDEIKDWWTNIRQENSTGKMPLQTKKKMKDFVFGVDKAPEQKIHYGFESEFNKMLPNIEQELIDVNKKYPDAKIVFTGHSRGGAGATIMAYKLRKHLDPKRTNLITFGSPRSLSPEMADEMNEFMGNTGIYRVAYRNDPITQFPFTTKSFKHPGTEITMIDDNNLFVNRKNVDVDRINFSSIGATNPYNHLITNYLSFNGDYDRNAIADCNPTPLTDYDNEDFIDNNDADTDGLSNTDYTKISDDAKWKFYDIDNGTINGRPKNRLLLESSILTRFKSLRYLQEIFPFTVETDEGGNFTITEEIFNDLMMQLSEYNLVDLSVYRDVVAVKIEIADDISVRDDSKEEDIGETVDDTEPITKDTSNTSDSSNDDIIKKIDSEIDYVLTGDIKDLVGSNTTVASSENNNFEEIMKSNYFWIVLLLSLI